MSYSMKIIQTLLFAFNFVFWLIGLGLITLGAYIYVNSEKFYSHGDQGDVFFIIGVGLTIFILGFLGCCGAIKAHVCMITTFGVLLIVIFILQVAAGIYGYSYRKHVAAASSYALDRAVEKYFQEKSSMSFLDMLQEKFHCCGNEGYEDYNRYHNDTSPYHNDTCFPKYEAVPSCHAFYNCTEHLYRDGCHAKFVDFLGRNMAEIGGVSLMTAFVQIVGVILAFCLVKKIKEGYEQMN